MYYHRCGFNSSEYYRDDGCYNVDRRIGYNYNMVKLYKMLVLNDWMLGVVNG